MNLRNGLEDKTMKHIKKALDYVRNHIDMSYVEYVISKGDEMRCPYSYVDAIFADDITDLLEEYGEDNYLPEAWWANYYDLDEIIGML